MTGPAAPPATSARCILIAEDEMCLALMLEDILEGLGYRVLKAARVPAALALVGSERVDAAILDINLAGTQVFPVADALRQRGTPFLFVSGYGMDGLPAEYRRHPMLQKPYAIDQLQHALARLLDDAAVTVDRAPPN